MTVPGYELRRVSEERINRHLEESSLNLACEGIGGWREDPRAKRLEQARRQREQEAKRPHSQNGWVLQSRAAGGGTEAQGLERWRVGLVKSTEEPGLCNCSC